VKAWLAIAAVALAAACTTTTDPSPGDRDANGAGADAAPPAAANLLGQSCETAAQCPSSIEHECVLVEGLGNQQRGYCSPLCIEAPDCTDGYDGPGNVVCMTERVPAVCMITCDTNADCPDELECTPTGGPVSVCVTAP